MKLKHLCLALFTSCVMLSPGWAAKEKPSVPIDVNSATVEQLQQVSGLGPVRSKAIIEERNQNGAFKDADDLSARVKGLGQKKIKQLQSNGLVVGHGAVSSHEHKTDKKKISKD